MPVCSFSEIFYSPRISSWESDFPAIQLRLEGTFKSLSFEKSASISIVILTPASCLEPNFTIKIFWVAGRNLSAPFFSLEFDDQGVSC